MSKRIAITLKPTNGCNMRCRHCYHAEEGFDATVMNPEHAKKMMLIASQEYDEIHVVFHGGEPTLWGLENFRSVLDYQKFLSENAGNLVFKNSIQTNGLLINDEWMGFLRENKFAIGVSFDGPHNDDLRMNTSNFSLDTLIAIKKDFLKSYYSNHRMAIRRKIEKYGPPYSRY